MTKPGRGKKLEKDSADNELNEVASANAVSGEEANANATSATMTDILAAITALKSTVDKRFDEVNATLSGLKSAFDEINVRLASTEEATHSHEKRIDELERRYANLASEAAQQRAKLDDLEARSRRQNIRIVGIKEKAEEGKPTDFVAKLLPELLGREHFNKPIKVDRAHRSFKPAQEKKSRPIVARLHDYKVKELVMRLARQNSPLTYDGATVFIFPDLTSATLQKRHQFDELREKCKKNNIRYGFRHPARFIVTVDNNTDTFDTPAEAERFLKQKVTDW